MITGVGVLIFSVNRSRIGVGFYTFGAGLESESQKRDSGHLCLGPLLFIIYVNDFPNCLKNGTSLSFADDTSILISGNNAKSIFEKSNQELDNVDIWLIANKLSLNASKTKCVYFRTVNSKPPPCALNLVIRNKLSLNIAQMAEWYGASVS